MDQNVNIILAFTGGVVTFFASCFLPLVPTYLAYLSGLKVRKSSHTGRIGKETHVSKGLLFINSILFSTGFILVFMFFGYSATKIGNAFADYRDIFQRLGGSFMILIGLFILGAFKPLFLLKEFKINLPKSATRFIGLNSFLLGVTFGFAWSPCIGPLLGVILVLVSNLDTAAWGMVLLFFYGFGISVPFIIISLLFDKVWPFISKTKRFLYNLNRVSGILIIIAGILVLLNKMSSISIFIVEKLNLHKFTF